jgi:hypothetical protein
MGISPSEAIIGAAFVGSISLVFCYMASLIPNLKDRWQNCNSRSFDVFIGHLEAGKRLCPLLAGVSLNTMENKIFEQVQKIMSIGIQMKMEEEVDRSVPDGRPAGGAAVNYTNLSP